MNTQVTDPDWATFPYPNTYGLNSRLFKAEFEAGMPITQPDWSPEVLRLLFADMPPTHVVLQDAEDLLPTHFPARVRSAAFWKGWGSGHKHHAYEGGLADHTAEVVWAARKYAEVMNLPSDELRQLVAACLLHDIGKLQDYDKDGKPTQHKQFVRHVVASWAEWEKRCAEHCKTYNTLAHASWPHVGHAILAHHGRREWGSPVGPATTVAWLTHWADMASVQWWKVKKGESN